MTRFEAHGHFIHEQLEGRADRELFNTNPPERWAAMATSLASLSGMLDVANLLPELYDAARHGLALIDMGALSLAAVEEEADDVVREVLEWGDAREQSRRQPSAN